MTEQMRSGSLHRGWLLILCVGLVVSSANAQDSNPEPSALELDNVTIVGHRRDPADVPGSAHVVSQEELKTFLQGDVMRVLRTVPGVFVQEEERQ